MSKILRTTMVLVAALALSASGCGKDKDKGKKPEAAKPTEKKPVDKPVPEKMSSEDFAKKLIDCWAAFDANDVAKFAACYTDKTVETFADFVPATTATGSKAIVANSAAFRTAFPDADHDLQLVLVNGPNSAVVFLAKGTNTGSFHGAPPTGNKVGYLGVQTIVATETGDLVKDTFYFDQGTISAQLGMSPAAQHPEVIESLAAEPTIAIAKGDDAEKVNAALIQGGFEAFNAHDVDKLASLYADDALFKWVPSKDESKGRDAVKKGLTDYYKMTSDVKTEVSNVWAAGDYVVVEAVSSGTHDGDMGPMKATNEPFKLAEVHVYKLADAKIAEHWVFANSLQFAHQVGLVDPAKMGGAPPAEPPAKK
jgi:steroid delta-isomerase-like uncharacterized protein